MKLETFFAKFDQLADAPNAIRALRELVLQLAVRGNLTERVDGESCSAQLKLADAFRVRRGRRGEPDTDDVPFPIPENWGWVAVGDSMGMINGKAFKPEEWSTEGTPIIRIQNLNNEQAAFNRCNADLDPKIHVHDGDFLISWSGTPGTSFGAFIWARGFAYLNQHIFRCELVEDIFVKEFLRLAINARLDEMISHAQGAVGLRHITKGKLESIRLPLPPLAEQKRIVTKVHELMALCDRLEAQQQERETRHAVLARASLARFADAPTPANLNLLFHDSYTIRPADLRMTILSRAVQGKLVPQDPNDESAQSLFDRMAENKARLILEKKVDETHKLHLAAKNEPPPWQPEGWEWRRFWDVIWCFRGHNPPKSDFVSEPRPGYVRFIQITDFKTDSRAVYVPESRQNKMVYKDEIIMAAYRHIGKLSRRMEGAFNVALCKVMEIPPMSRDFVEFLIGTDLVKGELLAASERAHIPSMHSDHLLSLWVPVPPLAEQRRIVAKVDQLMALVDQLEAQLAASRATAANLLEALVAELTARE